ncbi:hypothetical protein [Streptomyces sp. Ru87]|uniref:hypothetical protein n=1 Tax=Streptomyces sp. Ru87 TaxID=2044307 RepID=UPI000BF72AE3|nr:hypothetical protein [Streptomyces sp. Ru87]PGH49935.1 hypothetical protein CRI70_14810 [Streptomyces sp. Ru87]
MIDLFARPLDSSRLQARDHAHAQRFADTLPDVILADPSGSVTIGDLSRAVNKRLNRASLPGIPTSTVRRLVRAVGFRTRNLEEDVLVQGVTLR